jgi:hypothetical protein
MFSGYLEFWTVNKFHTKSEVELYSLSIKLFLICHRFFPTAHVIEVRDAPILSGIKFTQLKVKLSGRISCLAGDGNCGEIPVNLQAHAGDSNEARRPVATVVSEGKA